MSTQKERDIQTICASLVTKRDKPPLKSSHFKLKKIPSHVNHRDKIMLYISKTKRPLPGNPVVLFAHGDGETIDTYMVNCVKEYSSFFTPNGMSFCIIDYRGSGYSEGEFSTSGINETEDLVSAIYYLKKKRFDKISFFGRSLGAHCGIHLAARFPELVCIALDSPFVSIKNHVIHKVSSFNKIDKESAENLYPDACKIINDTYGIDFLNIKEAIDVADKINQPIFVIHGNRDSLVPMSNSLELMEKIKSTDKKFVSFDAGHNDVQRLKYFLDQFVFILRQNGSDIVEFEL